MGIWAAVKKSINSDLTKPLNTLLNALQTTANTINTNVGTINTNTSKGAIKSIQKGTRSGNGDINLAMINSSKSFFILHGAANYLQNYGETSSYGVLTDTKLSIHANSGPSTITNCFTSWQVIELY